MTQSEEDFRVKMLETGADEKVVDVLSEAISVGRANYDNQSNILTLEGMRFEVLADGLKKLRNRDENKLTIL